MGDSEDYDDLEYDYDHTDVDDWQDFDTFDSFEEGEYEGDG